jgi:nucleotide-binding universal stress UspA family protein
MYKHLLIPTDGSSMSKQTAQAGIRLAKALGARVTGLFVMAEYPVMGYGELSVMPLITSREFLEEEQKQARTILAKMERVAQDAGVDCETCSVVSDTPYQAIIDTATNQGCDLIFMASHGRRGLEAWVLGSETNKVLTHSKIPVLVYR